MHLHHHEIALRIRDIRRTRFNGDCNPPEDVVIVSPVWSCRTHSIDCGNCGCGRLHMLASMAAPSTPCTVTAISISQPTWLCIRMPSHRRRSYSRDRSRTPPSDRDRSRSRSPERKIALPGGADPISESDYFLKNDEFREWLKEEKNKVRHRSHAL